MHRRDSFKQHNTLKISSVHINHAIYNRVGIGIIHESNLPPTLQVVRLRSQVLLGWTRTHLCKIGFLCKLMTVCPCHVRWRFTIWNWLHNYFSVYAFTGFSPRCSSSEFWKFSFTSLWQWIQLCSMDEISLCIKLFAEWKWSSWYTPHITEYIFFLLLNLYFSRRCLAILGLIYSVFG